MEIKHSIARNALRLSLVVLIIIIALLAKPALEGFKLNKEFKQVDTNAASVLAELELIRTQTNSLQVKLEACEQTTDGLKKSLSDTQKTLFMQEHNTTLLLSACSQNNAELRRDLEQQINTLQEELENVRQQQTSAQDQNSIVIQNAANNICCKEKVDDSSINSYSVINNRIVCLSEGDAQISC